MKGRNASRWNDERGIVLIVAMLVMAILSVMGLAFLMTARTEDAIAVNYRNHTAAFYAAEAGLESGVSSLKSLLGGGLPTKAQLDAIIPAPLTDASYAFDAFQIRQVRATPFGSTIDSGPYAGLNAQFTPFQVTASVTGPRGSRAQMCQTINYTQIPLFQFAIFYGKGVDLEITPAPPAVFTGRIHANSNLYLKETKDTKFDGKMTSAGNIYRHVKPDPSNRGQNVQIKDAGGTYRELNFDHDYDYDFNNPWSESEWRNAALSTFGGTVQDGAMGVQEILPPIPGAVYDSKNPDVSSHLLIEAGNAKDSPELQAAKMYYQADVRIENGILKDQAGKNININKCSKDVIQTKTFYDPREQSNVQVTEVDLKLMSDCGVMPTNGVIYAYNSSTPAGVRLKNGAELPKTGLTVASENPVYIMGDYNTVNKVPAAVMGDAVYVLSNNWEKGEYDTKTADKYNVTDRPAADTTVNAAVMLGPHAEAKLGDSDSTNGYFENIFRFLEDWRDGGKWPDAKHTFTYNGSIISLWHSQQATAPFSRPDGKKYRTPPNRPWSYDTMFDTQLPPGTPMGTITTRGQWSEGC